MQPDRSGSSVVDEKGSPDVSVLSELEDVVFALDLSAHVNSGLGMVIVFLRNEEWV